MVKVWWYQVMDGAARTRDPEPANTFTQHSQHREPWGLSDFCLEKSEIVSLLSVDCIVTQWNQLYSAFLYFFEEKSDLLWRGEMWAQSNWEKVTVFLCRKWHKMKCFVCREAALEIRGSHGDCLDPQVLGTSCYGVLYAMARPGSQSIGVQFSGWSLLTKYPGGDCDSSR